METRTSGLFINVSKFRLLTAASKDKKNKGILVASRNLLSLFDGAPLGMLN